MLYPEYLRCFAHFIFSDKPLINTLRHQANNRIAAALRPRTSASYIMAFKQFIAFIVYMNLIELFAEGVILSRIFVTEWSEKLLIKKSFVNFKTFFLQCLTGLPYH